MKPDNLRDAFRTVPGTQQALLRQQQLLLLSGLHVTQDEGAVVTGRTLFTCVGRGGSGTASWRRDLCRAGRVGCGEGWEGIPGGGNVSSLAQGPCLEPSCPEETGKRWKKEKQTLGSLIKLGKSKSP